MSRSYSLPPEPDALGPLDRIEELLGDCLARPEAQWEGAVEATCRAHPEDATRLRQRFAALRRAGLADSDPDRASDLALVRQLAHDEPDVAAAFADAVGVDANAIPGLSSPRDGRLGTLLANRYRLTSKVGAGAMGVVYRARDEDLGRDVAIKVLDAARFGDKKAEARFLQEAELLAALRHDAIVTLHDRGRSAQGELYLVMELLDGVPLTRVLEVASGKSGPDSVAAIATLLDPLAAGGTLLESSYVRAVVRWGAEVARGLAAAHAAGILHRDIKPSNVFVRRDGRAVLLDFGIATRGGDLTAAGTVLGTPWYMAPEQVIPKGKLTPALDVYGLSSCLYHLLAGQPPFDGDPVAVLARIARDDPPRLSAVRPELPADLRAIVETGMARAPGDRYASVELLAADLEGFLEHRPVRARPLSRGVRVWRSVKRRPARAALVAATAAIVALGAGFLAVDVREKARAALVAAVERKHELMRRLPELLAFEGNPEQRLLESVRPDNRLFLRELDEIVALDPTDIPPRLWRAAVALDEGQHDAAAQDLAFAAQQAQTPYLRAVAARYQRAVRDVRGTLAIDLANLGVEPSSPEDCFVAGFHELRNRHVTGFAQRADELLSRAPKSYLPARDLRLIALVARGDYENPEFFQTAIYESLRLEGVYGGPTARTLAMRGAALVAQGKCKEALHPLRESLKLRPGRHSPWQNLAVAYRALGDKEQAQHAIDQAFALRPHLWNTRFVRAQILMDRGEFATAYDLVATTPDAGAPDLAWRKPYLLATIACEELCALRRAAAPLEQRRAVGERASGYLDVAEARSPAGLRERAANRRALVQSLTRGDDEEACIALLDHLSQVPDDPIALKNVALMWPESAPSARLTAYLRLLLATLAHNRAAQDNVQAQAREAARQRVEQLEQARSAEASLRVK